MGKVRIPCAYCDRDVRTIDYNPSGSAHEVIEELTHMMVESSLKCKCGLAKKEAEELARKESDLSGENT